MKLLEQLGTLRSNDFLRIISENDARELLLKKTDESEIYICAGTQDAIIAELVSPLASKNGSKDAEKMLKQDTSFLLHVLRTHEFYFSSTTLLKQLITQFRQTNAKGQLRVLEIISHWLHVEAEDLCCNETCTVLLQVFFEELRQHRLSKLAARLEKTFENRNLKIQAHIQRQECNVGNSYGELDVQNTILFDGLQFGTPILPLRTKNVSRYFALLDLVLFRDASHVRTVLQWKYKTASVTASPIKIREVLQRTYMIRHWVAFEILSLHTKEERAAVIEFFLGVAKVSRPYAAKHSNSTISTIFKLPKPLLKGSM